MQTIIYDIPHLIFAQDIAQNWRFLFGTLRIHFRKYPLPFFGSVDALPFSTYIYYIRGGLSIITFYEATVLSATKKHKSLKPQGFQALN